MSVAAPAAERTAPEPRDDGTGHDRIVRNILAGWGGHTVFLIAGFVLPRFIDSHAGQTALGVWDFGWSLVSYFGLAQVGIGSSVNRYVAKHRAEGDTTALNTTVSSVMAVQLVAAVVVLILTALATVWLPKLIRDDTHTLVHDTRFVVMCLGLGLAVQVALNAFNGVVTGCHRWDLHSAIGAGFHGATVVAMLAGLALGGGLRALATAHLVGTIMAELARVVVARRICPELRVGFQFVEWARTRTMVTFGGKVVMASLSTLLIYQTTSVLIAGHLGFAALALYARPLALVRHISAFVQKLAFVLTPTASSMHAAGRLDEISGLLMSATRYSAAIAVPPLMLLTIMGGPVLRLWMGPQYEQAMLVAILAIGHLPVIAHSALTSVLTGLDRHGPPALLSLAGAVVAAGLVWAVLGPLGWGLAGAAVSICGPLSVVHGILLPIYACRTLGVRVRSYYAASWGRVLICTAPFAICLGAARLLLDDPLAALLAGGGLGGAILTVIYWHWIIPDQLRRRVLTRFGDRWPSLRSYAVQTPSQGPDEP